MTKIIPINSETTKTSIFYINDFHGKTINMERTVSASNCFDAKNKNRKDLDTLKLSSGDIMLGENITTNKISVIFQNVIGVDASTLGNHEFDIQENAKYIIPDIKYDVISSNIKINPENPLSKVVKSSVIEEKNGNKYGIIGITPIDLFERSKQGIIQKDISVDNPTQTLKDIQTEINKLKSKSINKIILLSHLGYTLDKIVATKTTGLDIIIGGHSHELVFDVKEGENLFYNKNGEPVVITQAGRDGENFGILNLEFDKNGIIKKVQNNIGYTKDFRRNLCAKYLFDKIFGDNKTYGQIKFAPPKPNNELIDKNPHAYFIADCIRKDLNADIVLLPSANLRGYFEQGEINARILNDIMPFKNKLYKVNYSEKDIVDAIKEGAKSFIHTANKPGIFYCSGLKYKLSSNGDVLSLSYVHKNGKETPIDINNPDHNKYYQTIINDYCAQGNDKFTMLNKPDKILAKYSFDASKCVINTLKKTSKPIEIKDDNRIEIIKSS
ncbi:5'-nucleotidase C-terminal domain-containing protein [bacterium]|nr:5'-nucleotidase C-terminal domain-containing protein [bacterium]